MSELPGMWEEADLSGGWADTDGMSARERLVTALTNLLARTRNGRMEAHRAEAERLVEEAMKEQVRASAEVARRKVADMERRGLVPSVRYVVDFIEREAR